MASTDKSSSHLSVGSFSAGVFPGTLYRSEDLQLLLKDRNLEKCIGDASWTGPSFDEPTLSNRKTPGSGQ